jgi:hypothetical protein
MTIVVCFTTVLLAAIDVELLGAVHLWATWTYFNRAH